jgi:Ca2+-transporting ATPase
MAMGAWRISRARVLTRRAASIETLGSATVLCTDKTGTLTANRMNIAELHLPDGTALRTAAMSQAGVPAEFAQVAVYGLLASAREPFDPMERAFHSFVRETPSARDELPDSSWHLLRGYGLRPNLLAMTQVWQKPDTTELVVASKGAPEAIACLCRLTEPEMKALRKTVDAMAVDGLRVLGVAAATHPNRDLPES